MNEINSFTFYKNYYELLDNLPKKDKLTMLESIVDYVFKDIEPKLNGLNLAIWKNIVMPIDKSKHKSNNAKKINQKEIKLKSNENQIEIKKKSNEGAKYISTFIFYISSFIDRGLLRGKVEEWLKYKSERKEYYKETGFKTLLKQINTYAQEYGDDVVINLIDECMASNYKGIIWDRLKNKPKRQNLESKADWQNVEIDENTATADEIRELEERIRGR